jgi:hypothetical protein
MYDDGLGVKKCQQGILAGEKLKKSCVFFGGQVGDGVVRMANLKLPGMNRNQVGILPLPIAT